MQFNTLHGKIPNKPIKAVVYGPEGIGKSTFASKFPSPVFIDTEGSTAQLDVARLDPPPSSWTMLQEMAKYVKSNPGSWQTLVIDTADWAETLCINEICDKRKVSGIEDFGYGKGYVYVEEEFGRFLNLLNDIIDIGINVVFTAHAQMRKFEQPDELGAYDRYELKLEKKIAALLKEWADIVLFANYKTYVVNVDNKGAQKGKNKAQGGKRVMYTTHHPCWDAKNRHGLPDELPFDYNEIAHIPYARPIPSAADMAKQIEAELKEPVPGFDGPATPIDPPTVEPPTPDGSAEQVTMEQPAPPAEQPHKTYGPLPYEIPKKLADLMVQGEVTVEEIQAVVAKKGYYPANTPIKNYDPRFIDGVLVGAWYQVYAAIKEMRIQNNNHNN